MSSISVIVPVNNEEENLQNFYQRTSLVLEKIFQITKSFLLTTAVWIIQKILLPNFAK